MRAPFTPSTAGRAVGFSVRVDIVPSALRRAAGHRLLADDLEAEALDADDALLAVGQQHHLLDPEIDQDLGADAVVAQLDARRGDRLTGAAALLGQHHGEWLADQHDDAAALLGDVAHRGLDLTAPTTAPLPQRIGEQVDGMHAHGDRT